MTGRNLLRQTLTGSLLFLFYVGLVLSCSTGANPTGQGEPLRSQPEAAASDDQKPTGIYKGVLTTAERTGHIKLRVRSNAPGSVSIEGVFDGKPFSLSGSETRLPGSAGYRYDVTGTDQNGRSLEFSTRVTPTGTVDHRQTSLAVEGNKVGVNLFKERSDALVRVFEGEYGSSAKGTWNFIERSGEISGSYAGEESDRFGGRLNPENGTLYAWGENGKMIAAGRILPDESAHGSWRYEPDGSFSAGTAVGRFPPKETGERAWWRGKRTL